MYKVIIENAGQQSILEYRTKREAMRVAKVAVAQVRKFAGVEMSPVPAFHEAEWRAADRAIAVVLH